MIQTRNGQAVPVPVGKNKDGYQTIVVDSFPTSMGHCEVSRVNKNVSQIFHDVWRTHKEKTLNLYVGRTIPVPEVAGITAEYLPFEHLSRDLRDYQ